MQYKMLKKDFQSKHSNKGGYSSFWGGSIVLSSFFRAATKNKSENRPLSIRLSFWLFIAIMISLLSPAKAVAGTYYLDAVNGNDANPGSSSAPWKTIAKAKASAIAGDTMLLRSGNYGSVGFDHTNNYGTNWQNSITYKADTGAIPVFSSLSIQWEDASTPKPRYLEFDGIHINVTAAGRAVAVWLEDVSYLRLKNCDIKGLYSNVRVGGITLSALQTATNGTNRNSNILIDGCEVTDSLVGMKIGGYIGENVVISNNHIHHIAGSGIALVNYKGNGKILIDGNHIHNQSPIPEPNGGTTHGTGISIRTENLTVRNNIIHDYGNTRGIRTYQIVFPNNGYSNMLFENNLVYDIVNLYAVEFVDVGQNFVVRNNTFVGHYNNRTKAYWYNSALMAGTATNIDGSSFYMHNNVLVGNLMMGTNLYRPANNTNNIIYAYFDGTWRTSYPGNIIVQGNTTHSNYFEGSGNFFVGGPGFNYNHMHGINLNDAFQLAPGSPAIGYANPAQTPPTDLLGNLRDSDPDAGCYEYGASGNTNQRPNLNPIGNKSVTVGETLEFNISATDPENDAITFSAGNLPQGAIFAVNTQLFTWTPEQNQTGTHDVTFSVSDGYSADTETIAITVTHLDADNDSLPDYWELQYFNNLDQNPQDDPDEDGLTNLTEYENGTNPAVFDEIPDSLVLNMKFDEGTDIIAQDSSGYGNTGTLINNPTWTAGQVASALGFDGIDDQVNCGNDSSLNLTDSLTICAWINPRTFGQNGWGRIVDKGDGTTGYSFFVDERIQGITYVIYGGILVSSNSNTVTPNQWQHVAVVYDQSSSTVTFYVDGQQAGSAAYATSPADSANSPLVVGIRGFDLRRAFDGLIDEVRVYNEPLSQSQIQQLLTEPVPDDNAAPVLEPIGGKTTQEDQPLSFTITATDADDDSLTYSALNLPTGAIFDAQTQLFSWAPDFTQAGFYQTTFFVSDAVDLDSETISITVQNVNRAPVFDNIPDTMSVDEGTLLAFNINATDPDDDTINYLAQNLPETAAFSNQTFNWTPGFDQADSPKVVTFLASDGELEDIETTVITVNNVNRPPMLQPIGNKSTTVDSLLTFTVNATDPDGDQITYSAQNLPAGATFENGVFNWTPATDQAGFNLVTFVASDGQLQASETITITVSQDNNDPLVLDMRFDDDPADGVLDSSAYGNDGICDSPVLVGGAYDFDGTDDYVDCGNDSSLNLTDSLTISAWINPRTFGQNGWGRIVDKGDRTTGYSFFVDKRTQGITYVIYGGILVPSNSNTVTLNQWQHVAVVYDQSSSTVTFYVDGQQAGSAVYATSPVDSANSPLVVGIRGSDFRRAFDGLIDELKVYNTALSQNEILQLYSGSGNGHNSPPVLQPIGNKSVNTDQNLTFEVVATDPDDDAITYSASNLPAGANFEAGVFSWTPASGQAGEYAITFVASDGQEQTSETITVTVYESSPIDDLVLDMRFDDDPADGVLDSSSYNNHGDTFSTAYPAMSDGAYDFDGNNDYISIQDSPSLNVDTITLSAWIYVDAYKKDQRIISKEIGKFAPYSSYTMLLSGAGRRKLEFRAGIDGRRTRVASNADIPLRQWTHVAATYDGTKVTLYINGKIDKTYTNISGPIQDIDNPVLIGASQFYTRFFDGKIDDVKIYNRALSSSEILTLTNR